METDKDEVYIGTFVVRLTNFGFQINEEHGKTFDTQIPLSAH